MEFVGKNKMSPAEKRVMHARICMVCTIYAFYHCVNSFVTNDMSAARIAFGFAIYSGFLAKDGIEILIHFPQIAGFLFFSAEFSRILESGYFKRENISTSKSNLKMKNLRLQSWASFRQFLWFLFITIFCLKWSKLLWFILQWFLFYLLAFRMPTSVR